MTYKILEIPRLIAIQLYNESTLLFELGFEMFVAKVSKANLVKTDTVVRQFKSIDTF